MSKYALPVLTGAALALAGKPKLNLETRLDYSYEPVLEVAGVEQTAVGTHLTLTGCSYTSGDPTITHDSNTLFAVGDVVTGAGIPDGARVLTKTSATAFELDANTTATVASAGTLSVDTASTASMTAVGTYVPPATGYDLQLVLLTGTSATSVTRVKFAVVLSDGSNGSATGVIKPPLYADQRPDSGQGIAVDLTTSDPSKTIRSITSLTSVHGGSVGAKWAVWKLPEASSWVEIKGAVQKNVTPASTIGVSIPDRYNPTLLVKKGRGIESAVNLSQRYSTSAEGLMRLNGQYTSLRLRTYDNDVTLAEVEVLSETFLQLEVQRGGDGNEETMVTARGAVAKRATFV